MEITYEEAQSMLQKRFSEYPKIKALVEEPTFKTTLIQLVEFEGIDTAFLPVIENEVKVVLAFYTPVSKLVENIAESTKLSIEVSEKLVVMIEAILLAPVMDDLYAFDFLWNAELEKIKNLPEASNELKEKLELRPEGVPVHSGNIDNPKPLTREEVLQTLSLKRTMKTDIASLEQTGSAPIPHGYEAYRQLNSEEKNT